MGSKREHLRVNCGYPCILNLDGINYLAQLKNLSLGGALVKVSNIQTDTLCIGATVDLKLSNNPDSCSVKHSCKVVRLDESGAGIDFKTEKLED
jgi:c-di-GMP-binding flagellar brake protein YcgR